MPISSPALRSAVSSAGKMPAWGTIRGRRIWPRRPMTGPGRRAERPASSAPRCGAGPPARRRRPAVTRTIGVARASSSHQRRRKPSRTKPAIPSATRRIWIARPSAAAHRCADAAATTSARPCARSSPGSRAGLRRSTWRSSACRSCRGRSRAAGPGSGRRPRRRAASGRLRSALRSCGGSDSWS